MMYKALFACAALLIMLLPAGQAQGQANINQRLELEVNNSTDIPIAVPIGPKGVILLEHLKKQSGGNQGDAYLFTKYSTTFEKDWQQGYRVMRRMRLKLYGYEDNYLYMVFHNEINQQMQVLQVNPATGDVVSNDFFTLKKLRLQDFAVLSGHVFFIGQVNNSPVVFQMDTRKGRSKVLPSAFDGKSNNIIDIYASSKDATVNIVIGSKRNRRNAVIVRSYDVQGTVVEDFIVTPKENYSLLTGRVQQLNPQQRLVAGTFAFKNSSNHQGFYISGYAGDALQFENYFKFTELENFFSFMDDKQQAKTKERVEKRASKGKDLRLQYRLLIHDLVRNGNQYIMIGEAYYPTYTSSNFRNGDPYSWRYLPRGLRNTFWNAPYLRNNMNQPRMVFDGHLFTHAVIAAFDTEGNLLWDNCFKIDRIKTFELKEHVKLNIEPNGEVTLIYPLDDKIKKMVIEGNEVVEKEGEEVLASNYSHDRVKRTEGGDAAYWYEGYFIAYGFQRVKNAVDQDVKKKRNIFYMNKLAFN